LSAELLEAAGARVSAASSADHAQHARCNVPDVIVMDLGMPRVGGFQLLEQIRTIRIPGPTLAGRPR